MASREINIKFTLTSGTKTTANFTGCSTATTKDDAKNMALAYEKLVDGQATAATYKSVEDIDLNG